MAILQIKDGEEWKEIEAIQGPEGPEGPEGQEGPKGESGVYTGTSEPSSDYDVWIIPDGTPSTIPTKVSQLENDSGYITSSSLPTKVSDLQNDSGFIDNTTNTLTNYELKTNTGATIDLSIDSSTYVMSLELKNSAGTTISTDSIDLPLETMVVGASYDSQTKEIVLTLKNGNTTRFSVADLVNGLVSSDYLTTNYYDKTTVDTNIANLRGTTLYNNADGSTGNIPLSDSASNYICFDIITSRGGNGYGCSRVYSDYMTNYTMINSFYSSDIVRFYICNITISGTTITRNYSRYANFPATGANTGAESDFRIHKVIGYK